VNDTRNEAREFVGSTRDEAVAKAVAFFGVEEAALRVQAPSPGEIYGLGPRVVVVAQPANAARPARGGGDRDRGERPERGDRDRGGRGERRDRGGRGGREEPRGGRGRERGGRSERAAEPERARAAEPERARPEAPAEPSVGTVNGSLGEAGEFVKGLVERLEAGPFEVSESDDGDLVVVQLRGSAAERVGGGDGRVLDAIQFLVNQSVLRKDESARRIVLDAEADPAKREMHLSKLAERAAGRAGETGRAVALDPMNGRDRRVIHVALRDWDGVATMSIGEGRYRQVVVVPEGAPEYEEARRASEAAATQENG